MLGLLHDARAAEALELLRSKQRPDGTWRTGGRRYWRRGNTGTGVEAVTWGDAHQIVTPVAERLTGATAVRFTPRASNRRASPG